MNEVEEIKQKIDIVDFISQYLNLKKSGVNYKGLCPFHNEKTPSFMVSADKQIFKCFGCGVGGDVIEFLMKMENLEFPEALEILADKTGVSISKKPKKEFIREKEEKTRLYKINNLAALVYHKILMDHPGGIAAREYLAKRKISQKTCRDFQIGYAPKKAVLKEFLAKNGFSQHEIQLAGSPDRFIDRIIFPICDVLGNVIGFSGRVLDKAIQPKYLNTSETAIFHKSRVIYGLNLAKLAIKAKKSAILVEGQMDVVLSHQAGVINVVASSGTALTSMQLEILSRYVSNMIFAFDQDEAGKNASQKAIEMAISLGINCQVMKFPKNFKDVGEVVEKDARLWQKISQKPLDFMEWLIDQAIGDKKSFTANEKKEIARKILPFIKIISDEIEKSHWIKILAEKIDTPVNTIYDVLGKVNISRKNQANLSPTKKISTEENFIGLILFDTKIIPQIIHKIDYRDFSQNSPEWLIYKSIQSCYTKEGKVDGKQIVKTLPHDLAVKANFLLLEVEKNQGNDPEKILDEILQSIEIISKQKKEKIKNDFAKKIQQAEEKNDIAKLKKLLIEFQNAIK